MSKNLDDYEKELLKPFHFSLGENNLLFQNGKGWIMESSDIDKANSEIINLKRSLEKSSKEISILKDDLKNLSDTKAVVLELLIEERQRNYQLEQEIIAYKAELKENYKTILEIKQQFQNE